MADTRLIGPDNMSVTMLRDTTHNFHLDCIKSDNDKIYGRGVLVGLVGGFMAMGLSFHEALTVVKANSRDCAKDCIPASWKHDWNKLS